MKKHLFAFDLDGTLLDSEKRISHDTLSAIKEMHEMGHEIVLASGRLGTSMMRYKDELAIPFSTVTLNGAAAYIGAAGDSSPIFTLPLPQNFSEELHGYFRNELDKNGKEMRFALNFYYENKLYTYKECHQSQWVEIYKKETSSLYNYVDDHKFFIGKKPGKILFCGEPLTLDNIENEFREKWHDSVYIVRTWDKYLEFLNAEVNKAAALEKIAMTLNIPMSQVIAFGDGDNDSQMLRSAGFGIAVRNGTALVKDSADKISKYSNNEDVIKKEWDIIKRN